MMNERPGYTDRPDDDAGGERDGRRAFLRRLSVAAGAMTVAPAALAACSSTPTTASTQGTAGPGGTSPGGTTPDCAPGGGVTLPRPTSPQEVFEALRAGNERFASGKFLHPNLSDELWEKQAAKQTPFAAVLTCADSRTAPELVFDQGVGDLFVVRVAGNIADPSAVASLAYAVGVLGVEVILTMGHEHCGAVKTAVSVAAGEAQAGEFAVLLDAIAPAVTKTKTADKEQWLEAAIKENARLAAQQLPQKSAIIRDAVAAGKLLVTPSDFSLTTAKVEILS